MVEETVSHLKPKRSSIRDEGGPIRVYGTFGGENFNRRCRFDVEAPPAVYKLPERFVSVSTKAYAVNASHVTCQGASINCVSCRGRFGGPS